MKVVAIGIVEELGEVEVWTRYFCKQRDLRARRRSHCGQWHWCGGGYGRQQSRTRELIV